MIKDMVEELGCSKEFATKFIKEQVKLGKLKVRVTGNGNYYSLV